MKHVLDQSRSEPGCMRPGTSHAVEMLDRLLAEGFAMLARWDEEDREREEVETHKYTGPERRKAPR